MKDHAMNTHIVSGSHRADSQSIKVSRHIASLIEAKGGRATVTDLSHNALPLWDEGMWSGDLKWKPIWSPIETRLREADSLVIVTPEYAGMASAAIKNFFLFCSGDLIAHKPALLVAVSAGQGGSYPISEMRASSYKNSRVCYLPDHVLVKNAPNVLNGGASTGPDEDYLRKRIDYSVDLLAQYEKALKPIRSSGMLNYKDFPFGM
jgi:azobenzene reductase